MNGVIAQILGIAVLGAIELALVEQGRGTEPRFAYIGTDAKDSSRLVELTQDCASASQAFHDLLLAIPSSDPLATHASDSVQGVVFGAAYAPSERSPRLTIRLADLERLPSPEAVRRWSVDSGWAITVCEVLGHEIVETLEYRERWRLSDDKDLTPLERFNRGIRLAHLVAIEREENIAVQQRTRLDESGKPYGRGGICVVSGSVHIQIGRHTETLKIRNGALGHIAYNANVDLCGLL